MEKKTKRLLFIGLGLLSAFVLWTVLLRCIDLQAIGPNGSCVGFAAFNEFFHKLTGTHLTLYIITDWIGLVPIGIALGFAILGLAEWIRRKSIFKVDKTILALGIFYVAVMLVYIFFEYAVINYRPILIEGRLEASYPSSTTMLASCVLPTAMMQFNNRIKSPVIRRIANISITALLLFTVIGRIISGVHWITDIIGGALFSAGIVTLYYAFFRKHK